MPNSSRIMLGITQQNLWHVKCVFHTWTGGNTLDALHSCQCWWLARWSSTTRAYKTHSHQAARWDTLNQ